MEDGSKSHFLLLHHPVLHLSPESSASQQLFEDRPTTPAVVKTHPYISAPPSQRREAYGLLQTPEAAKGLRVRAGKYNVIRH